MNQQDAVAEAQEDIKVQRSFGRSRCGIPVFYVRPTVACQNNSRRFSGYDKMRKGIKRWFAPAVNLYIVDGHLIGSNSEMNALREYHRVCEKEKIGKYFEVKLQNL